MSTGEREQPVLAEPRDEVGKGGKGAKVDKKAERIAARAKACQVATQADTGDPLGNRYGDTALVASAETTDRKWTAIDQLTKELENKTVLVRGRVHAVRGKGKSAFLMIRQAGNSATVQAILFADDKVVSKGMVKYASLIPRESIVDVEGVLAVAPSPVESCTQSEVELKVTGIRAVHRASPLPLEVTTASRSDAQIAAAEAKGEKMATVNRDTRLDNRVIDLRTPANQAIFKVQSAVSRLFREVMMREGFIEIHTPKLIGGASEGGASVFTLDYMGQAACLAQSPQFYKQQAICADMGRVFEIGPVFRAEKSFTHRHLCEFTGLDFEMAIFEHYNEVLDMIDTVFTHIFTNLNEAHAKELEAISEQYPFEPLQFLPKMLRITFAEGTKMLNDAGHKALPEDDLNTEMERTLGKLVKDKYGTDFFAMTRYPLAVRPFYTMPAPDDPKLSNSFDVFIRGEEIISGAQRIHDPTLLAERAAFHKIEASTIQPYLDSFKYGAPPHGGIGVGLERVVMLFCALGNIRLTSMFPRDPKRLTP